MFFYLKTKTKIWNIFVFFVFLTAKINGIVLIESNSKYWGIKWNILKFKEFEKSHKSSKGQIEIFPNFNY